MKATLAIRISYYSTNAAGLSTREVRARGLSYKKQYLIV